MKNKDPTLSKAITKDDEIKTLTYKTENIEYEKTLKSLKVDKDFYTKNILKQKKEFFVTFRKILGGVSGLTVATYNYLQQELEQA